ncbi:MAG TPA: tetratricopeptide repeat protein [Verrucomicrobiae bacterium]|nr:tetratricopeptide repeat protein [Verrucomicrobiae bacterium]
MKAFRNWMFLAMMIAGTTAWAQQGHHHELTEEEVGSVHFVTTCGGAGSQGDASDFDSQFNQGVALLHSFEYERARGAFEALREKNPRCAMVEWGIAMSHYHGLWANGDMVAGRAAIEKARELANANATSEREKGYIEALGEVYGRDARDKAAKEQAFEKKMGELAAANLTDTEAAIFHALSLAITAPKMDKTFANQRECGQILEPIFKAQPHHPGVAHYIIHCYDNPVLAEQGLGAARMYAKIAPASAHANHMPSHIFTRVGSWEESIASNRRSAELAAAAERESRNGEARDQRLHAMDYLEYAYLQSGQVKRARAVLDEVNALKPIPGLTLTGNYATAAIPARYAIELGNWDEASRIEPLKDGVPWAQAIVWEAIGEGSARTGKLERAAEAEERLADLRDASAKTTVYWSKQVEVERLEVGGWIAVERGKKEEAVAMMRSAAELEESMDKDAVTPGPVTPGRELLARVLMEQGKHKEALEEYEAVLKVAPKRFNAIYGAGVAADASGNNPLANKYFQELLEIARSEERAEVTTAKTKLGETAAGPSAAKR